MGIALGILLIAIISASSLGVLLATSALAFSILKYTGAAYLFYLGIKLWRSPIMRFEGDIGSDKFEDPQYLLRFKEGFLVSLLNPKPIFFFMSLFPQFISKATYYNLVLLRWHTVR